MKAAVFGLLCLLGACGQAPAGPSAPAPSPAPTSVVVVPPASGPLPPGFPPGPATLYRRTLTREIQFYWGLTQEQAPFFGQVHQESRWSATAQSRFAGGLGQFTPPTAQDVQRWYAVDLKELCAAQGGCPFEPAWALRALVLYDRRLWVGVTCSTFVPELERWACTLASYNGGSGWISREKSVCEKSAVRTAESEVGSGRQHWSTLFNAFHHTLAFFRSLPGRTYALAHQSLRGVRMTFSVEVVRRADASMQAVVTAQCGAQEVAGSKVRPVFIPVVDEYFTCQIPLEQPRSYEPMDIPVAAPNVDSRIAVEQEDRRIGRQLQSPQNPSVGALVIANAHGKSHISTCDPSRYFKHVELRCGASAPARSKESCAENRHYPAVILTRWGPLYAAWLR